MSPGINWYRVCLKYGKKCSLTRVTEVCTKIKMPSRCFIYLCGFLTQTGTNSVKVCYVQTFAL